ncbi:restriction endonuclease subunit S [Draconibacterium mangrovi]|uniref:restriction endonuclease subunit S n=1 Tax=Draconibacterium mangrovi TaxID=2697469 RepID=UPI0013D220C8|nr:restriction endonuclease subunit S [Draconibacterium mangrovi]
MKFEKLGNKIKQIRGISYKPNQISDSPKEEYMPVLKANNITPDGLDDRNLIFISNNNVKEEQIIKRGDILLAASSGSKNIVGKNIYFNKDYYGSFGAFCKLVRPDNTISSEFLSHFFHTDTYKNHIRNSIQGANINNLKNEHVDNLRIPVIPFKAQLHIANILSKAESLIAQRKESIRLLDEYLKSVFLEMFGDSGINNKKWETRKVKELSLRFSDGPFGSNLKTEHYSDKGIQVIRLQNIGINNFIEEDVKYIDEIHYENVLFKYSCYPNDVVIATMGAPNIRACIIPRNIKISVNKADCVVFRPNHKFVNQFYISYLFNQEGFLHLASSFIHGQTRARISSGQIAKIEVPVPPLKLQTQFAKIVEKTEDLKAHYQQSLQELEKLYGSLSQKAFKGKLSIKNENLLLAAEPNVEYKKKKIMLTKQEAFLRKLMLASHIINELCEEPTFGHTKLMKLLYLSEQVGGMALQTNYKKFAAGPFDGKTLTLIDLEYEKNGWFSIGKRNFAVNGKQRKATIYQRTEKSSLYKKYFDSYFAEEAEIINKLISLFAQEKTQTSEIVATLYYAWKEQKENNVLISEQSLIKGFYKFHKEKRKFTEEQIKEGYQFMMEHKIYPD